MCVAEGAADRVLALRIWRSRRLPVVGGLALLMLAALGFSYGLGAWPLMEPDEGRNAEVAREMLETGRWSVPQFNGLPYLDKPVLLFWMIAAAFRVAGLGEGAARIPSALAAVVTTALTYDLGRVLLGRRHALLAAAVLATTPIVLVYARLVIFDMPLTALVTGALCCLVRARVQGNGWLWLPLAGLAMGLATLTKGPVGIAVPLIAWAAGRGALPPAPNRRGAGPVLAATVTLILVVAPWIAIVARQEPDFLRYAFLDETVLRFLSPHRFHRGAPVYYYLETLAWALGAWGVVLVALAPSLIRRYRSGGRDAAAIAFAVRAAGAIVVFFTVTASKRPHYILPALVPLSILAAVAIVGEPTKATAALRTFARWAALAGVVTIVAVLAGFEGRGGEFVVLLPRAMTAAGIFLVAWGLATTMAGRRPAIAITCAALFAPGLGLVLLGPLTPYAELRSARTLASYIDPAAPVFCFDTFRTSLPFYLRRPVVLASASGRALTSNYVVARRPALDGSPHLIRIRALRSVLDGSGRPFIVASRWNAERLTHMSPRPLIPLYMDRSSILFQAKG